MFYYAQIMRAVYYNTGIQVIKAEPSPVLIPLCMLPLIIIEELMRPEPPAPPPI